ncbi:MAG: hypothetical protein ACXVHT_04895 [Methanobacterium sp.]
MKFLFSKIKNYIMASLDEKLMAMYTKIASEVPKDIGSDSAQGPPPYVERKLNRAKIMAKRDGMMRKKIKSPIGLGGNVEQRPEATQKSIGKDLERIYENIALEQKIDPLQQGAITTLGPEHPSLPTTNGIVSGGGEMKIDDRLMKLYNKRAKMLPGFSGNGGVSGSNGGGINIDDLESKFMMKGLKNKIAGPGSHTTYGSGVQSCPHCKGSGFLQSEMTGSAQEKKKRKLKKIKLEQVKNITGELIKPKKGGKDYWVLFVKYWVATHPNLSYKQAMQDPECRELYRQAKAKYLIGSKEGGAFWDSVWNTVKDAAVKTYDVGKKAYSVGKQVYDVAKPIYDTGKVIASVL